MHTKTIKELSALLQSKAITAGTWLADLNSVAKDLNGRFVFSGRHA